MKRFCIFSIMLCLQLLCAKTALAWDVVWYPIADYPASIAPDGHGGVWFGLVLKDKIGHMDSQGHAHYYAITGVAYNLARDNAGNIWYTGGTIGYINKAEKNIQRSSQRGEDISYNEGKMWLITGPHEYASISEDAPIKHYVIPRDFTISNMAAGPDGNLWFTDYTDNLIGKVLPGSSALLAFQVPAGGPAVITSGPDRALWFLDSQGIGRITTTGQLSQFNTPSVNYGDIKTGADGNLWFTDVDGAASISVAGNITDSSVLFTGQGRQSGYGLFANSGGKTWFADVLGNRIGNSAG